MILQKLSLVAFLGLLLQGFFTPAVAFSKPAASDNGISQKAQQSKAYPQGIFISGGRHNSVKDLSHSFVDGVLIRVRWKDLQPAPGQFDWDYLDDEIAKVRKAGKKYTLAVVAGPSSPAWLYTDFGVKGYEFSFNNPYASRFRDRQLKIPVPWDKNYLEKWSELIIQVGQRFSDDPDLYLVHITGSSGNGFEMMLPYPRRHRMADSSMPDWKQYGYSRQKIIDAWKQTIDVFADAFPNHFLDLEIHGVLNDYEIPAEIIKYGVSRVPGRFGPFGAWLNNRGKNWDKPLIEIMAKTPGRPYCNYQLIGNETRQPERLGPGGLAETIELGMSHGCHYFEIWEVDIRNTSLHPWLRKLHKRIGHSQ